MAWSYEFLDLTKDEKALRRESLNHYASVAHWSAFAPIPIYLAFHVVQRVVSKRLKRTGSGNGGDYQQVPGSPLAKAKAMTASGELGMKWRQFKWWMGGDVYFFGDHRGQRDMWILGTLYMMWLLSLCIVGTGNDYLHLTKRFGIIAVSQMPIQYLLSLKSTNIFAYVFRSSHEEVNRYHRVLGRLIYGLLFLHLVFYNYFFIAKDILVQKYSELVVIAGFVAAAGFHLLMATALPIVRAYSYRIFFITHLTVSMVVPFVLLFHAASARIYVIEAFLVFLLDLAVRKQTAVRTISKVEAITGTNLFTIKAPIPATKLEKFKARPGSHIYLNIPTGSSPSSLFDMIYSPFTVAAVDGDANQITVVARKRNGPLTTHLASLAGPQQGQAGEATTKLDIEVPRGAAGKKFSDLLSPQIQRILLIAGGVGSSFIVPIYKAILQETPSANVQFIWAIRTAGEATWPVSVSQPGEKSILDDDRVQLFLTSDLSAGGDPEGDGEGVELRNLPQRDARRSRLGSSNDARRRPDLQKIVDDTFKHGQGEKIAVLVCGPSEMAREVRDRVTPWVMKGRDVWWHDESFGW